MAKRALMKEEKDSEYSRAQDRQTAAEEIANSITHGIGTGLSVAGAAVLIALAALHGDVWRIVSFSIYGTALIILYLASTLYHSFRNPEIKRIFKIIDHSAIYLLIAGTYTPFMLISLRGTWGWTLFGIVWALAFSGIAFKTFFIDRFKKLSVLVYLLMGWLCVIAFKQMLANIPFGGLVLLIAGGLFYTGGVIFYGWHRLKYNHAIWHLFVMGGSICHYFAIFFYLLPKA